MSLKDLLATLNTGGSSGARGASFWRPPKSGKYAMRLYRFTNDQGELELFTESWVHFTGQGGPPIPCSAPVTTCEACGASEALEAAGDDDSKEKSRRLRRQRRMTFPVVLLQDPTGFKLYEATESIGRNILLSIAKAGGFMGKWPRKEEMDEFYLCLTKGIPNVCGPAGKDIYLTVDKDADPKNMYTVDLQPFECKTLPFPEDVSVPNPGMVRARIDAARAAKAGK